MDELHVFLYGSRGFVQEILPTLIMRQRYRDYQDSRPHRRNHKNGDENLLQKPRIIRVSTVRCLSAEHGRRELLEIEPQKASLDQPKSGRRSFSRMAESEA